MEISTKTFRSICVVLLCLGSSLHATGASSSTQAPVELPAQITFETVGTSITLPCDSLPPILETKLRFLLANPGKSARADRVSDEMLNDRFRKKDPTHSGTSTGYYYKIRVLN